jgi:hypothetical protein
VTTLTFLIPVRHPANSRDWARSKANIAETVRSISAQTNSDWRGLIIANEGSELPDLPERFDVEWVHFPPNAMHDQGTQSREEFLDAVRLDKGRRVLKGMLRARDSRFFMLVDDDDFISSRIVQFVSEYPNSNGWLIDRGYFWDDGSALLQQLDNFNRVCGTSHIIRSDLYGLPSSFEEAAPEYIKTMLGSHYRLADSMAERGAPLANLPFRGAIYRVGQSGSHSLTPSILKMYFLNSQAIRNPRQFVRDMKRLRLLNGAVKREFFGAARV